MKINVIEGKNGCQEIEIDIDNIDGVTKNREFRTVYIDKKKYRLTLNSYEELVEILKKQFKWHKYAV